MRIKSELENLKSDISFDLRECLREISRTYAVTFTDIKDIGSQEISTLDAIDYDVTRFERLLEQTCDQYQYEIDNLETKLDEQNREINQLERTNRDYEIEISDLKRKIRKLEE